MGEFDYGFTDEYYDGSAYEEGRSDAIDEMLDIIKETIRAVSISGINKNFTTLGTLTELYDKFSTLKGGK